MSPKKSFFTLLFLIFSNLMYSQDIITQKNGDELEVKITEMSDDYVKFYYLDDPDKVEVKMNRSLIRTIEFEYGRKETEIQPGLDESYYVDDHRNNILVNFTAVASKSTIVAYERGLNPFSSVGGLVKIHGLGAGSNEKSGFGIEANYKVKMGSVFKKDDYRPNHLLHGFYVRPNIGYTSADLEYDPDWFDDEDRVEYDYLFGGFDIGKQWIFNNIISLDLYTGINFYGGDYKEYTTGEVVSEDPNSISDGNMGGGDNTAGRFGLQLGITF